MLRRIACFIVIAVTMFFQPLIAKELPELVRQIKPATVGIGIYNPVNVPRIRLIGTGFVLAPGNQVVTNHHVVAKDLSIEATERYVVLVGQGPNPTIVDILRKDEDRSHDLAILTLQQPQPHGLTLAADNSAEEGQSLAFTGFPITDVLGLYPATHRATLAAITPIMIPTPDSKNLDAIQLKQLRNPFMVYQLDATAYPGNSGSPLYELSSGQVVGIINMVYVKNSREKVLSEPSGISYAIPSQYIRALQQRVRAQP